MNAEEIRIDWDEDGCYLIVKVDDFVQGGYRFRVTDPEQLYDRVKGAIGPWLRERDETRGAFRCNPDESGGVLDAWREAYPISDPKHPDYHSVHADIWDAREGK